MELNSFRELLIKKSRDRELVDLVHFMSNDALSELVVESLEKMARARHKGDAANVAMRDFGVEMDHELEPKMIHDALSHHASRYKAAIMGNRPDVANAHAKQIFRTMDMADQLQKHSHGKLEISAVSPHAWERNAKLSTFEEGDGPVVRGNKKAGQFRTDTKGWRYRGKDYSFLQQAPHESYSPEVRRHGHNEAYPMEHIRVNGKYLHIDDVPPEELKGYEEHPFDKHPIMKHFEIPVSKRTAADDEKWMNEKNDYYDSHHIDSFMDKHERLESQDPEGYAKRGSAVSSPVHGAVDTPLDVSGPPTKTKGSAPKKENFEAHKKAIMDADIPDEIKQAILGKLK